MISSFKKLGGIFIPLVIVAILALGAFGYYEFYKNISLGNNIQTLQKQVGTLSQTLQKTGALSEQNQTQLKNLAGTGAKNSTASASAPIISQPQVQTLTSAVAKAIPAVVSIVISKDVPKLQVQYVNPFGTDPSFQGADFQVPVYTQVGTQNEQVGAGSGFIIRSDGYIVTNRHVVDDPTATYTALLASGVTKTAIVVYTDPVHDLAIVKIDGTGLPTASLGDSSSLELGQTIAAIGNALGQYNNSVSTGIVSGLNRTIDASDEAGNTEKLSGIIQTDAAINPGNSGGPLIDLSGNVVGVNVATVAGSNNIAFSIPINSVKTIIAKVLGS